MIVLRCPECRKPAFLSDLPLDAVACISCGANVIDFGRRGDEEGTHFFTVCPDCKHPAWFDEVPFEGISCAQCRGLLVTNSGASGHARDLMYCEHCRRETFHSRDYHEFNPGIFAAIPFGCAGVAVLFGYEFQRELRNLVAAYRCNECGAPFRPPRHSRAQRGVAIVARLKKASVVAGKAAVALRRAAAEAPRDIDKGLLLAAGKGNTIVYQFLRVLTVAAIAGAACAILYWLAKFFVGTT